MFPLENGLEKRDVLLTLILNFALDYAIRRVQINKNGLKFSGTHFVWVYADDVNIMGGSVLTVKEKEEALVVASKEIGLEVNVGKTKYMVMSRDQNAGQSHNLNVNMSFEIVEQFKYLRTNLSNQNCIQESMKGK
jgi:hypothetical protein